MDLSDLRIFLAVVREGGVTRAAERLNRVQSNVTTRIRQLEQDLDATLFIREGKRLRLAPAGQSLLGYAERLLALAEEARSSVHDPKPRGLFRLGSMESTAAIKLPKALNEYVRLYPEVTLELRVGNPFTLGSAILAGQLDAALVAEPIADEPFDRAFAFEEEGRPLAQSNKPLQRSDQFSQIPSIGNHAAGAEHECAPRAVLFSFEPVEVCERGDENAEHDNGGAAVDVASSLEASE